MKSKKGIFRFQSIRTSIMVSFSVLILFALLIFMSFSMNYTEGAVVQNSQDYSMQLVEQVNSSLDTYIDYMGNIAYMMTENQDVVTFLQAFNTDEFHQAKKRLTQQFSTILDSRLDIYDIGIIGTTGRFLFNRGEESINYYVDYRELDWFRDVMDQNTFERRATNLSGVKALLSASHVQNVISGKYPWVVTLSVPIIDKNQNTVEGVFFVDLNYSSINSLGKNISLGNRGYVFIVDDEENIIYHPKQQLIYSGVKTELISEVLKDITGTFVVKDEFSRVYTYSRSDKTGWTAVGVSYLDELMRDKDQMQSVYYLSALVLMNAAILLASFIASKITKPLSQLRNSMKAAEKGEFSAARDELMANHIIERDDEIAELGETFHDMTEQIQKLMEQNVQEQREKRKSELNALQSQINPHFLYNTLDSIIWMAEDGKNQEVVLMTSSLAKLLRQSISNDDEIVTIEKEIGYTRSYLTIQKMRYKDQLEFHIDLDEDTLNLPIVKLVVQPLVENAIYHGIKYAEHKGTIWISTEIVDDHVVITVEDNGKGMEPEVLEHILEQRPRKGKTGKVGVYNVHNRLQLYYGPEYGLTYESEEGVGTTVTITIPKEIRKDTKGREGGAR